MLPCNPMQTRLASLAGSLIFFLLGFATPVSAATRAVTDSSPLHEKADYFLRDLLDKYWLEGLYVSIVPAAPPGTQLPHTVNQPGNVIHAGVWTGRYLGGVGYAIYYDLAADPAQREFIRRDVDRLMTHLLENQCRIMDVDGEVTRWGHVGIDPNPAGSSRR